MSQFIKVFTKRINPAPVKTDKAEEKLLDDDPYVPLSGHIGFINRRIQRCSKCKRIGHNKTNKNCPANVDLTDLIEDEAVEAPIYTDIEAKGTADRLGMQDTLGDEELASVEDLLDSDEELF